jgi:hypothetical protein
VAKEVTAIKYGNTTGHSIKKILESPFAGKHFKVISKGTKAAAAVAAVTAAEAIAVADLEETNRLAAEFEAGHKMLGFYCVPAWYSPPLWNS